MSEDFPAARLPRTPGTPRVPRPRRSDRWFHELADELSPVDGSAVVWLPTPGEFARPLVLPGPRRPTDGYPKNPKQPQNPG